MAFEFLSKLRRHKPLASLRPGDAEFLSAVRGAQVVDAAPAAMWAVYLMLAVLAAAVVWASIAKVDIIIRADGRVVPDGREQVIASLEGGILREMLVREGQQVMPGQELALLDPTRFESQQAEGQSRRLAMRGTLARLQAEASGRPLEFPPELQDVAHIIEGETDSHDARRRALDEAVALNRRNITLLNSELTMAERMSAKGLMSEVEVMRLRRQANDLQLQTQERINRFRQEASAELVKLRNELALVEEQMVVRDDALRRTTLTSPVRGLIKQIRANTIGGVIAPGAPVMEILPLGSRVLVEARIKPADIGFVKLGQEVMVKLTAYEYTVYGGLKGTVQSISPDVLRDPERAAEGTFYRALVRADRSTLKMGNKPLAVLPGMVGRVEVRTGQRTVLGYILRPMMKSQEAFRER
jgi:adhesin transport system membrane fusion protein